MKQFRLSGVFVSLSLLCALFIGSHAWAVSDGYVGDLERLTAMVWVDSVAIDPDHGDEAMPDAAALPASSIELPNIQGGMVRQSSGSSPIPHTADMASRLMPGGASARLGALRPIGDG